MVAWSGWPFHRAAAINLRRRVATMDTLVSMGTLSSWVWSAVVLVAAVDGGHVYFETGAVIVALILLGKWLESRARRRSGDAIRALGLRATSARVAVLGCLRAAQRLSHGPRRLSHGRWPRRLCKPLAGHSRMLRSSPSNQRNRERRRRRLPSPC